MERKHNFPEEKRGVTKENNTSMNVELQEWLKETKDEIRKSLGIDKIPKKEKKPKGVCQICGKNAAKFVCLKCGRSVCPSCYFNILGVCKKCVPEEYVKKWEEKTPDWEKILGVKWVD